MMAMQREEIVKALGLIEHPEGGFFLETYRSGSVPMSSKGRTDEQGVLMATQRSPPERNVMTSIYFMLTSESPTQCFVVNESDHMHYWHGGSAIQYHLVDLKGDIVTPKLGGNIVEGEVMQLFVPSGWYKAATLVDPAKGYGLLGEAVAPGFDFRDHAFVTSEMMNQRTGGKPTPGGWDLLLKEGQMKKADIDAFYQS